MEAKGEWRTVQRWEINTRGMEDTLKRNKRGLGDALKVWEKQKGNGGHSNGDGRGEAKGEWRTLSREAKGKLSTL